MTRHLFLATAAVTVACLNADLASAHDLRATVLVELERVTVVATYNGDEPADRAQVVISLPDGSSTIATGLTNERGAWSFPVPTPGEYVVVVRQGGHRAEVKITVPTTGTAEYAPRRLNTWAGMAIGLGVVLAGTVGWWWVRRRRSKVLGEPEA